MSLFTYEEFDRKEKLETYEWGKTVDKINEEH